MEQLDHLQVKDGVQSEGPRLRSSWYPLHEARVTATDEATGSGHRHWNPIQLEQVHTI